MDLLTLPNEVLLAIADSIVDLKDYYSFLRTNLRLANLLIPYLYRRALRPRNRINALCWAGGVGNECMVRWLIEKGVFYSNTPVSDDHLIESIMLKGANFLVADCYRVGDFRFFEPALRHAIIRHSRKLIFMLLKEGARVDATDIRGNTALHAVAQFGGDEDVTRELIRLGADVEATDHKGRTPLHCIRYDRGGELTTKILLEHGADTLTRNYLGENVIQALIGTRRTLISPTGQNIYPYENVIQQVRYLLMMGNIKYKDLDQNTGLHLAAATNDEELADMLICRGVDIDAQGYAGRTALYMATYLGHSRIVRMLLEAGADAAIPNNLGMTAIHITSIARHKILRLFVWKGVNVNVKDANNFTPLHWAASAGDIKQVNLLLKGGADHTARGGQNWTTPIMEAADNGSLEVVMVLMEKEEGEAGEYWYMHGVPDMIHNRNHRCSRSFELLDIITASEPTDEMEWVANSGDFWKGIEGEEDLEEGEIED